MDTFIAGLVCASLLASATATSPQLRRVDGRPLERAGELERPVEPSWVSSDWVTSGYPARGASTLSFRLPDEATAELFPGALRPAGTRTRWYLTGMWLHPQRSGTWALEVLDVRTGEALLCVDLSTTLHPSRLVVAFGMKARGGERPTRGWVTVYDLDGVVLRKVAHAALPDEALPSRVGLLETGWRGGGSTFRLEGSPQVVRSLSWNGGRSAALARRMDERRHSSWSGRWLGTDRRKLNGTPLAEWPEPVFFVRLGFRPGG